MVENTFAMFGGLNVLDLRAELGFTNLISSTLIKLIQTQFDRSQSYLYRFIQFEAHQGLNKMRFIENDQSGRPTSNSYESNVNDINKNN